MLPPLSPSSGGPSPLFQRHSTLLPRHAHLYFTSAPSLCFFEVLEPLVLTAPQLPPRTLLPPNPAVEDLELTSGGVKAGEG